MKKRVKKSGTPERSSFPAVDRSRVVVGSVRDESDEKAFWLGKTPLERLEAVELLREIAYGHDAISARLQRVLEVAELPRRCGGD